MEEIKTQLEEKNSILSAEQKRQISNKLVFQQIKWLLKKGKFTN